MIRNVLIGYGALVVVIILAGIASAYGGSGQGLVVEKQSQNSQVYATDPFRLEPGLAVAKMTHSGEGSFVVNLVSAMQEETIAAPEKIKFSEDQYGGSNTEVAIALAEEAGPVTISRAVSIPVEGKHLLDVKADGPWTVEVEQPQPSSAPRTNRFSGDDDTATPFFSLSSGPKQINITNPLEANLNVSLLDSDGNVVKSGLANETGQAGQIPTSAITSTVDIPENSVYLFNVRADGLWTIEIVDAE
jgi:hypothetical protein